MANPSKPVANPTWLGGTRRCALAAAVVAAVFLVVGLGRVGLIDPHELDRAELARRIAVHALGADHLALEGDPATIPTLGDLGAGELGFTSIAAGFATLGLSEAAGRLPLALWALAGALALFVLIARLASGRAAFYAVVALVTMPAYFVQARTMLGDAVAMGAFAICLAGLTLAAFDDSLWGRAGGLVVGIAGAVAGYLARGLLLGVAAPIGAVGLAWLVVALHAPRRDRLLGGAMLSAGVAAAAIALADLARHGWSAPAVTRVAGATILEAPPTEATFDLTIRDLGHALFPWSALLPLAIGVISMRAGDRPRRELGLAVTACLGGVAALAAHAWIAPYAGALPFVGLAALAAIVGLALAELDQGGWPPGAPFAVAVIAALLYRDLAGDPERSLVAYGLGSASFEGELEVTFLKAATLTFVLAAVAALAGAPPRGEVRTWLRGRRRAYVDALQTLGQLWKGNLVFGFLLIEAALVGVAATIVLGRSFEWPSVLGISFVWARFGLNAWWLLPLALAAVPLGLDLLRLGYATLGAALRLPRAGGLVLGALVAGAFLCFGHHPALAARLSPRGAFENYRALGAGEPLALLGLSVRGAHYHAGVGRVESFDDPAAAHRWLVADDARRWLVLRQEDLPALNEIHRATTARNLAIAASEPPMFLATNRPGEVDLNPLAPFVRAAVPAIQHPLDHVLGEAIELRGVNVLDMRGHPVEAIVPGRTHRVELIFRVLRPLPHDHDVFLHLDGEGRRHNGDHAPIGGLYPTSHWRVGDVIVDPYDLELPPSFPPGSYRLFVGLYRGEERMPVTRGRSHGDRVLAATLTVR